MTDKNINTRFCRAFRRDGLIVLTFARIYFNDETGTPWRVAFFELSLLPDDYQGENPVELYFRRHHLTSIIGAANWQPWQVDLWYRLNREKNLEFEAEDRARRDIRDICDHYTKVYCVDRGITETVLPAEIVANFERCIRLFYLVNLEAAQKRAEAADCLNQK